MAKARKILRHRKAIKNIATITKTMGMVATSRFKKTFDRAAASRSYAAALTEMLADLVAHRRAQGLQHPLLCADESNKNAVLLVLTSHRGLCGAYNNAVIRMAAERMGHFTKAGFNVRLECSGKRGMMILHARGMRVDREYTEFDYLTQAQQTNRLADAAMAEFIGGRIGGFEIAYTQFISAGQQRPAIAQILPLTQLVEAPKAPGPPATRTAYELWPSAAQILDQLLPATVRLRVYQCFLDASVSEQIARMTAMQSATENANEMIHQLTVQYNRARQSQITTELAEIMGGAEGVSK